MFLLISLSVAIVSIIGWVSAARAIRHLENVNAYERTFFKHEVAYHKAAIRRLADQLEQEKLSKFRVQEGRELTEV